MKADQQGGLWRPAWPTGSALVLAAVCLAICGEPTRSATPDSAASYAASMAMEATSAAETLAAAEEAPTQPAVVPAKTPTPKDLAWYVVLANDVSCARIEIVFGVSTPEEFISATTEQGLKFRYIAGTPGESDLIMVKEPLGVQTFAFAQGKDVCQFAYRVAEAAG